MEYLGPALFGFAVVAIIAAVIGLRGRRSRRARITDQADWTSGADGDL